MHTSSLHLRIGFAGMHTSICASLMPVCHLHRTLHPSALAQRVSLPTRAEKGIIRSRVRS